MRALAIALAACLTATPLLAQSQYESHYDWQSGNSYNVQRGQNSTTVYGNNMRTGSSWNIRQQDNGSYSGTDSGGNFFTGNHRTGTYMNSNGTTCMGTGAFRTCN